MKIKRKDYIILLLMAVMFFLPYKFIFSKAEEISAVADIDPTISATLYDTNQYSSGTGVELTEEGAEVNGWEYQTSKFLQIDPLVPADGNTYIVTVKLPQEFYIVGSVLATPSGYQNVEFKKNESILINENYSYDLNTFSGTAQYTMNIMGMSGTIQLEIGYDVVLWDKMANSSLTPEGIEPIVVTLSKKDNEGTVTEIKNVSVGKATAGSELESGVLNYQANIEGELTTTNSNLNVGKSKKVRLVIKEFDTTAGYIYKYFPKITFTINLPYYTDESGTKHYLSIDKSNLEFNDIEFTSYQIDTSKMSTDGIVTIDLQNFYYLSNIINFWLGPLNQELENIDINSFLFSNGKISAVADGKNGSLENELFSVDLKTITYYNEDNFELVTYKNQMKEIIKYNRPEDAVSIIFENFTKK